MDIYYSTDIVQLKKKREKEKKYSKVGEGQQFPFQSALPFSSRKGGWKVNKKENEWLVV